MGGLGSASGLCSMGGLRMGLGMLVLLHMLICSIILSDLEIAKFHFLTYIPFFGLRLRFFVPLILWVRTGRLLSLKTHPNGVSSIVALGIYPH